MAADAVDSAPKTTLKTDSEGFTRLHITPFDADLLKVIVPAAILPQARNISYHTIDTFPDRRYGFVELLTADADKLRKKLNGATLKGTKVRIEQARPEFIPPSAMEDVKPKKEKKEKKSRDKSEKSKKRKWEAEVAEGVVVEDRKIKRGWTVTESDKIKEKRKDKDKKSKDIDGKKEKKLKKRETKSKYTNEPECLFKQKLPAVPTEKKKDEEEEEEAEPKRKKKRSDRQIVVHEFEKTTKYPTFLKATADSSSSRPLTYETGKGWVDEEGNVVEAAKSKRPSFSTTSKPPAKRASKPAPVVDDDDTSSSGSSSSESDSDDEEDSKAPGPSKVLAKSVASVAEPEDDTSSSSGSEDGEPDTGISAVKAASPKQAVSKTIAKSADDDDNDDDTSSSGSSSDDDDDMEDAPLDITHDQVRKPKLDTQLAESAVSMVKNDSSRPKSSGSMTSLSIKIPPIITAPTAVHPLEALYKRPAGTEAAPAAGFSFFGNEDDIDDTEGRATAPSGSQDPMTPYSKQDFEFRNTRSAAPTPDTAHPSRSYNLWSRSGTGEDDLIEEDEDEDEDQAVGGEDTAMANSSIPKGSEKAESKSEFQNWFWEHRGDLNRSWKKRRKTASKEKRNRENRARAARAI